ncbi:Secreted RxLR effector peptide protein [Phytophthora cinnamomi]|uniref:Secreted RxLR effector peptide protein n=1 Tax=Phytophthora cinnamomi TaxID=4785 RepID=UPI00355A9325|nr:Secreted RxLR effector peptide protein [Phytophthora cinnamomi]
MFTGAESAALSESGRDLRAQQVSGLNGKADDIAATFLQTLRKNTMLSKAKKLREAGNLRKADVLTDTAEAISRLNKNQKAQLAQMVEMAKKEPEKLSQMVAEVAKKDPKKWSKLKKVIVGVIGAQIGVAAVAGIIYGAVKLTKTDAPATA